MREDLTRLARYLSLHTDASADEVEAALRDRSSSLSLLSEKLQSRLREMYQPAPLGPDDPDYQEVVRRVEWWHSQTLEAFRSGDLSTAEAIAEHAAGFSRDFLGEDHLAHRTALQNWGWILSEGGHYDRAENALLRGCELARNADGTPASDKGMFEEALGLLRHRQGRYVEAVTHYESALALVQAGDAPSNLIRCARGLGRALLLAGNPADAQAVFEKLTDLLGEEAAASPEIASLLSERGSVAAALGSYEDAERLMRQSLAAYTALPTPEPIGQATTLSNLARLLEFEARLVDALQVREQLEQILAPLIRAMLPFRTSGCTTCLRQSSCWRARECLEICCDAVAINLANSTQTMQMCWRTSGDCM